MTPTILCVDDDPAMTRMLHDTLTPRGYHVLLAGSVEEAVQVVRSTTVNLVILDITMPGEEGFALFERLAGQIGTAKTPVIMASGCGSIDARNHAIRSGAIAYLQKPYQMKQLLAVMQSAVAEPENVSGG